MLHLLLCIYRPLRSLFFGFDSSLSPLKQPSPLFGLHTLCMLSYSSSRLDLNAGAGDATVAVGGLAASWQGWLADRLFGGGGCVIVRTGPRVHMCAWRVRTAGCSMCGGWCRPRRQDRQAANTFIYSSACRAVVSSSAGTRRRSGDGQGA